MAPAASRIETSLRPFYTIDIAGDCSLEYFPKEWQAKILEVLESNLTSLEKGLYEAYSSRASWAEEEAS